MHRKYIIAGSALVLLLDQATKLWAKNSIDPWSKIEIIPGFFNLVYVRNYGAAFGFLNRSDIQWQFWIFMLATAIAMVAIFLLSREERLQKNFARFALAGLLGGVLGNAIDRIRYRAVIDFLDFYIGEWHWPAFNVADIAIFCGAVGVFLAMLLPEKTSISLSKTSRKG